MKRSKVEVSVNKPPHTSKNVQNNLKDVVFHILQLIPKGKIVTYKTIADVFKISPRHAGKIISTSPHISAKCYKVIYSNRSLAKAYKFGGACKQATLLKKEGVEITPNTCKKDVTPKVKNITHFMWTPTKVIQLYLNLYAQFSDVGRWPWYKISNKGSIVLQNVNNTHTPTPQSHNPEEIVIGAILTQNTNWGNVEKALQNLKTHLKKYTLTLHDINDLDLQTLKTLIKPAGYYNQKAVYLKNVTVFFKTNPKIYKLLKTHGGLLEINYDIKTANKWLPKLRNLFLTVKGIGQETADTILLYAFNLPSFVIDKYTHNFVKALLLEEFTAHIAKSNLTLTTKQVIKLLEKPSLKNYKLLQSFFADQLDNINPKMKVYVYQRLHAFIVLYQQQYRNMSTKTNRKKHNSTPETYILINSR